MLHLPPNHVDGTEFFTLPGPQSLDVDSYFKCISALTPLLEGEDFCQSNPGFYINIIGVVEDNLFSLRLTYYSVNPQKTTDLIREFVKQNSEKICIVASKHTNRPTIIPTNQNIEENELKFRNFLNRNTQIFLDLLKVFGPQKLQWLVYEYRHTYLPKRCKPENFFEPLMEENSEFFRKLKAESLQNEYFECLRSYYVKHGTYGIHFLVNLAAVGEDWNYDKSFFNQIPG